MNNNLFPCSPGLSGSRNRRHHEKGTSDGWSRRGRAEVGRGKHRSSYDYCFVIIFALIKWIHQSDIYAPLHLSRLHPKRVFQTVKNLNLMRQQRSSLAPSPLNIPGSNQTSCFTSGRSSRMGTPRSNSIYGSDTGGGIILDNRTSSILEGPDDGYVDMALFQTPQARQTTDTQHILYNKRD